MKKYYAVLGIFIAVIISVYWVVNLTWLINPINTGAINNPQSLSSIPGILTIAKGGTGTSTAPTQGKLLIGNAGGGYNYIATSSLGITASETDPVWSATSSNYVTLVYGNANYSAETTSTIGALINGSTATTGPADTDRFAFSASSILRYITWSNIKAILKSYFDGFYGTKYTSSGFTTASTSTLPTATTTISLKPIIFSQTWEEMWCKVINTGTSTVSFSDGTNITNSLTVGTNMASTSLSANNTFTPGEQTYFNMANNTASSTQVSCSIKALIN